MIPSPPCPSREELPIRGSQVRRRPQARFLPLPVFVLIVLCGCAGLTPQREWVVLKTSSSTRYYSVRGTTTGVIFDDIERNGLFDTKARRAIGLTSGEWSIDWRGIETRPGLCSPESMTITLNLVVTLPQHDQLNDLSRDIRTNWQRFAARVAAPEQRHVDIHVNRNRHEDRRTACVVAANGNMARPGPPPQPGPRPPTPGGTRPLARRTTTPAHPITALLASTKVAVPAKKSLAEGNNRSSQSP